MFTAILYLATAAGLLWSVKRDRQKTKRSLLVAKKAFLNVLPELSGILILIAVILTLVPPRVFQSMMGGNSGFTGMFIAALIGSVTIMPGFVTFPLAKSLLDMGAGISQVIVFVSALMMVGFVTAPLEIRYFGRRQTLIRNVLAFVYSFVAAVIVGRLI